MAPAGEVWSRNGSPILPPATTLSYSGGPWPQLARSPTHPSSSGCSLQPEFLLGLEGSLSCCTTLPRPFPTPFAGLALTFPSVSPHCPTGSSS